jgi:Tfp pilus assembly protein PilN
MRNIADTLWNAVIPWKIERGSLRWILTLGFAAVIGLTACVGIIAVFSQIHAQNIVGNLLDKNVRIADMSLQSDAQRVAIRKRTSGSPPSPWIR